jgi:hypothetical protein
MLTADELALLGDCFLLRASEADVQLWAGISDERIPQAEMLAQEGLLDRVFCAECYDLHWRCSDTGVTAMRIRNAQVGAMN